jgi:hypothetical protein
LESRRYSRLNQQHGASGMNNTDDFTKPSRVKRRLKRRWKNGRNQFRLTRTLLAAILAPLSQKTKAGLSLPDNQGHNRPLCTVVFLCPPKTQAALCCLFSVMAGCIEQPLKRLAGSLAGSENLIYSATQRVSPKGGGYSIYQGVTA